MACIAMAIIFMANIVMANIVMAIIVMAYSTYGQYSYGQYSYGLQMEAAYVKRIELLEGAVLPFGNFVQNLVRDRTDQIR